MTYTLLDYQVKGIINVAAKLKEKFKIIFQLATGGGKTVVLCTLAYRYYKATGKRVLILAHRKELTESAIKTIYKWYDVVAFGITSKTKRISTDHFVYVGMVESVVNENRIAQLLKLNIGLIIMDEVHVGNFKKIHTLLPNIKVCGFSATPISSNKKDPLRNYFDDIVCGIDIPELIALNKKDSRYGLVENKTYSKKNAVNLKQLHVSRTTGDYNEREMGIEFSKARNVHNAYLAYIEKANGLKTIIFNCSVEHSMLVAKYFELKGVPSRHLDSANGSPDGDMSKDEWRTDCLRWFKETHGAVLHNVGILTTGYDEASIQCVLVNKSTLLMGHWLQMCGRGARPHPGKDHFIIIDLGGNAITHGDWCDSRDWNYIFWHPDKVRDGIAPMKECPNCNAIVAASAYTCKYCGFEFDIATPEFKYDQTKIELVLFTKRIDVKEHIAIADKQGKKMYAELFDMAEVIAIEAKKQFTLQSIPMTQERFDVLYEIFNDKAKEWYNIKGEHFTKGKKIYTLKVFNLQFYKHFKPFAQ